jgi:Hydrazine synthase alpha subunit middle domain
LAFGSHRGRLGIEEEQQVKQHIQRISLAGLAAAMAAACGGDGEARGPLDEVEAIVFIERPSRMDGLGDIFQYQSYVPGARLLKLSPPTADGEVTELCCSAQSDYAAADIIDFDVSFDAQTIVFSARLSADQRYGLFLLHLDSGDVEQLPTDPDGDFVYPTFLPGDRILFATNAVVEEGAPQFADEYERGTTLQLGSLSKDGSDLQLYSRNLSHRITSTVMHTGEVLFTQWDHLNELNAGHLVRMNPDGTRVREAFGKEGTGITNSYYKAVEAAPGRVIAIGSSRDRTFQSGAILDIRLGEPYEVDGQVYADREMSETNASTRILTAQVPLDDEPSVNSIGRYYNAYPLNSRPYPDLLVSWADGPVQSDVNGAAGVAPDFGLYLFDSERGTRQPIYDGAGTWEINPTPLRARTAPPTIPPAGSNSFSDEAVLIGAMNVYETSLGDFEPGSVYGVRVVEGFSGEEGVGNDFGLTESEGAATLGIAEVREDGSWAALIPANIPVHQIAIDKYGMGLRNEPVWITGRPGESRFCGGCHENRTDTTVIEPGITDAIAIGPSDLLSAVARFERVTTSPAAPVGIPWDTALQPIFDAKCAMSGCHDGTPGAANKSFTITDPETEQSQTFTFDLRGGEIDFQFGEAMLSGYSASHLSLLGPSMLELEEFDLEITGEMPTYVQPEDARGSLLIQKLNPPRQFPEVDLDDRAFGADVVDHSVDMGFPLTAEEHRLLIEMVDNGGQFYSRENAPGLTYE